MHQHALSLPELDLQPTSNSCTGHRLSIQLSSWRAGGGRLGKAGGAAAGDAAGVHRAAVHRLCVGQVPGGARRHCDCAVLQQVCHCFWHLVAFFRPLNGWPCTTPLSHPPATATKSLDLAVSNEDAAALSETLPFLLLTPTVTANATVRRGGAATGQLVCRH